MEADLHELVENISLTIEHKEVRDRGLQPIKVTQSARNFVCESTETNVDILPSYQYIIDFHINFVLKYQFFGQVKSGGTLNDLFHVIWENHRSSWIPDGNSWTKQQLLEKDYGDYGKFDIM